MGVKMKLVLVGFVVAAFVPAYSIAADVTLNYGGDCATTISGLIQVHAARLKYYRTDDPAHQPHETDAGKGLLRDSLLEEFIQKRPKTKDDWFRKIAQDLRTSVDSKQVGQYLDRVRAIIAEFKG